MTLVCRACMWLAVTGASLLPDDLMIAVPSVLLICSVLGIRLGLKTACYLTVHSTCILLAVTNSNAYLPLDSLSIVAICIAHSYRMTGNHLFVSVSVAMKEN